MDNIITEMAKQVPSLGVLAWLVWIFLKDRNRQSDLLRELFSTQRKCIDENTRVLILVKDKIKPLLSQ